MKLWLCFVAASLISITAFGQAETDSIVVVPLNTQPPPAGQLFGHIAAGNNNTATNCDYEAIIASAKKKALAMGGNLVKITHLEAPSFISSCYKIKADVYRVADIAPYLQQVKRTDPAVSPGNCAILYIYRLKDTLLPSARYAIHLNNDSILCHVSGRSVGEFLLCNQGHITLWAKIGARKEINIDVAPGKSYYLRCGIAPGSARQQPVLELVDDRTGSTEYHQLAKHSGNSNVNYLNEVH